ncbi:DUF1405 domain-containing protein [Peribacillus deserti]|uniref:DUF1405 domain-containing protein n=1 Tax=Peribacillus deserti TaxID=673318 RepID=A0A2N5M1V8_9BACI|nr:DUF1405 domain-containing protein [Peribacillus deserti]PLT28347.1 DUF1405 domain-containing protein [Peribacillus deserti]
MAFIYSILANRSFLWLLLVINIFGTVYGYYWYGYQLEATPAIFLPFVPDSPTATLFFVLALIGFLLRKNWGLFEALAVMTLFKYGIWAVVMNLLTLMITGELHWTGYMLMASHAAMAVQGLLYAPFYRIKKWHFAVAAIWTLHNEMIDYVFYQMPNYGDLIRYIQEIGYFTFWLSIASIAAAYFTAYRSSRRTYKI